jgi:putative heme iron utilization protein
MTGSPAELALVRRLLAAERHGVLSTAHARYGGWPFGSVAPYALTDEGDPLFLFSSLAEHTHNLRADPRASLVVQERASLDEPLAGGRATLMGRVEVPDGDEREAAVDRYIQRFADAAQWRGSHDFAPFVLRVERVRWILGFGSMGWFDRGRWADG